MQILDLEGTGLIYGGIVSEAKEHDVELDPDDVRTRRSRGSGLSRRVRDAAR